jgi:hypothetical protein
LQATEGLHEAARRRRITNSRKVQAVVNHLGLAIDVEY